MYLQLYFKEIILKKFKFTKDNLAILSEVVKFMKGCVDLIKALIL